MVGPGRLELPTSRLSGVRSNHLSYGPLPAAVISNGSSSLKKEKRRRQLPHCWCVRMDNLAPLQAQACKKGLPNHQHVYARPDLTDPVFVLTMRFCLVRIAYPKSQLTFWASGRAMRPLPAKIPFLRKEVIQPQVPLRLPCYDFTPVADPTVVGCLLLPG